MEQQRPISAHLFQILEGIASQDGWKGNQPDRCNVCGGLHQEHGHSLEPTRIKGWGIEAHVDVVCRFTVWGKRTIVRAVAQLLEMVVDLICYIAAIPMVESAKRRGA